MSSDHFHLLAPQSICSPKTRPSSLSVSHICRNVLIDPQPAAPWEIIWALPSLFPLLTLDAAPACHYLTSAALTCTQSPAKCPLNTWSLTVLCLGAYPWFSVVVEYNHIAQWDKRCMTGNFKMTSTFVQSLLLLVFFNPYVYAFTEYCPFLLIFIILFTFFTWCCPIAAFNCYALFVSIHFWDWP